MTTDEPDRAALARLAGGDIFELATDLVRQDVARARERLRAEFPQFYETNQRNEP